MNADQTGPLHDVDGGTAQDPSGKPGTAPPPAATNADVPARSADGAAPYDDPAPSGAARLPMLLGIAATILLLDLLTKALVVSWLEGRHTIDIIGDTVTLHVVRNPGAAFSMATGMTWLLTLVAVCVAIGVVRIGRSLTSLPWAIGLGLVLGGALGNLVDRFCREPGPMRGEVVDFVSVGWWPTFNIADAGIVCGAVLLVGLTVFGVEPDHKGVEPDHEEAS